MPSPRPITIISGFLGSGKTTLLNRVLHGTHGKKFAVIINEFGEIGLDAGLVKGQGEFVEMKNGCLCCALNEDLVKLLEKLKDRTDYEAIILETTGVADPLTVAWTFLRDQLGGAFRIASLVTVVDACHFQEMQEIALETKIQVERADIFYLSKTDIVSQEQTDQVIKKLTPINSNARLVLGPDPRWLELLFDTDEDYTLALQNTDQPTHHHAKTFQSLSVDLTNKSFTLEQMEDFFEILPKSIFRAKAVFLEKKTQKTMVVHCVCGRVDFYEQTDYVGPRAAVFIGREFDGEGLKKELLGLVSYRKYLVQNAQDFSIRDLSSSSGLGYKNQRNNIIHPMSQNGIRQPTTKIKTPSKKDT